MIRKIDKLVELLNQYRDEYYNLNKPSVSDVIYDKLADELKTLEKTTGVLLSNSPSVTVGYEVKSKLNKVTHSIPLRSLDKTKSIEELQKFIDNKDAILMLKADGLTVELIYEDGQLIQGSTRGNGETGEEITHNVKVFKNIPLVIPFKGYLKIVGEAIIHKNDFEKINNTLLEEDKYATPRNLSAGSVRQLNSEICSQRNVYFYAFGILECDEKLSDSKYEQFKWLGDLGFWTIYHMKLTNHNTPVDQLENYINVMKELAEDKYTPIDGMVISFDSVKYSKSLGETSHHPLHSLAFKFEDDNVETVLRDIEWNTTRTGQINPTAIFDTVIIDGTEVSRASLHNLSFIDELALNIGCRILVSKRNLIIPHVEDNLDKWITPEDTHIKLLEIPQNCPSCGEKSFIKNTGTADFLVCKNDNCPAQLLSKFTHFVSRNAMNIEGLSEATLEKFIEIGLVETYSDIYRLSQHKSVIIHLDGFGKKSYERLILAIENSKEVKMANFLYSLGILQIGKGGAKRLAKYFNNDIQVFLKATKLPSNFLDIEDIGDITAISIYEYFRNEDNRKEANELLEYVSIKQKEVKTITEIKDNPFKNCKIYGTGTFANYKKEELKKVLEDLGAEFASGYAKSLDYLIVGSIKGSSKEDKAKKDGIKILSEDKFMNMIGRSI